MKRVSSLLLICCILLVPAKIYSQKVIASFEEQSDFFNMKSTGKVDFSRSTDYPALGSYSCKVVFPEIGGMLYLNNIKAFYRSSIEGLSIGQDEVLHVFVWSERLSSLNVSVEDSLNNIFKKQFPVKQGVNHVQLLLSDAKNLKLQQIKSIGLGSDCSDIFYIDYISLDRFHQVLSDRGRWDVEYTTKIQSPHYAWGSDLMAGPIRTFSISPVFDGRGIVELAERLDIDFDVVTIGRAAGADKWGFGDFYHRRSPGLSKAESNIFSLAHNYIADDLIYGPEYDVIIWPGMHKWESYPVQVRDAVVKRVKNGAGLILLFPISDSEKTDGLWSFSPLISALAGNSQPQIPDREMFGWPKGLDTSRWVKNKSHFITRGVLLEAFPWGHMGVYPYKENNGEVLLHTTKGNPVLAISQLGKGRIVAMAYPETGLLPRVDNPWETGLNYPYWEYLWSMVARSVVWASGKQPDIFIEKVSRTDAGLSILFNRAPGEVTVNVQVTDAFGNVEEVVSVLVDQKRIRTDIKLTKAPCRGEHLVNVELKGDKGVFDWYSLMFETAKASEIAALEILKPEIPAGENVEVTALLRSNSEFTGILWSGLYDNYRRLVDEDSMRVSFEGEKLLKFTLHSKNVLTNLGNVDLILRTDGHESDRRIEEVFFLQPGIWDDYDITMYHFGPNPVPGTWQTIDKQLRELNVTTLAAYTLANSKHANFKAQAQTRISGVESPDRGPDLEYYEAMKKKYLETGDKTVLRRKYGLKDTAYLNSVRNDLVNKVSEWKKFSPSAYYIYEEPSITRYDDALDLCFRESTLEAMRLWLKEEYLTLKALNTQWGTNFLMWDEVMPDDTYEARRRGNYSSWADHRTFMEICWADQFKFVQDVVKEVDPEGLVQLSGTQASSSHNGYDYSRINKYVGQMNPYDIDNQLEYHHDFNPDLKVSGQAGYGALGKEVLYDYYNHLFLKETGGSYIFWQVSCLNPDYQICNSGLALKNGFDEMRRRGIGRLVNLYDPENEFNIAIHYSHPSVHASWIVDGEIVEQTEDNASNTLKQYNRNRDGWVKELHDLGFGFNFLSYKQIEDGGLINNGYKILILPMSMALSDREVTNIQDFVKQGGILIADALPGVMDNHTKFREERALSTVFGIKARGYNRDELIMPDSETDLKPEKAKPLSGGHNKIQLLQNSYGKGRAYLLNYFMDEYPGEKILRNNEASLNKLRYIFDKENLKSGIEITSTEGNPESGVGKYAFSDKAGNNRLLGLLPGKESPGKEIVIHFDSTINLYDIRNRRYMGEAKYFKIRIENSVPELFGILKCKIADIEVLTKSQAKRGDSITLDFVLTGENVKSLNSVVTVEVFDPKGDKIGYYGKNCQITNGKGAYNMNLALNDLEGAWIIRVKEVISNIEKEVSVFVN
jgi:hypothetical protein